MNYPMISAFHKLYKHPDKDLGSYSALRSRYPKSQGYFQNYFGMSSTQVGLREGEVSESRFSFFTKLVFVLLLALGLLAKAQLVPEKPAGRGRRMDTDPQMTGIDGARTRPPLAPRLR